MARRDRLVADVGGQQHRPELRQRERPAMAGHGDDLGHATGGASARTRPASAEDVVHSPAASSAARSTSRRCSPAATSIVARGSTSSWESDSVAVPTRRSTISSRQDSGSTSGTPSNCQISAVNALPVNDPTGREADARRSPACTSPPIMASTQAPAGQRPDGQRAKTARGLVAGPAGAAAAASAPSAAREVPTEQRQQQQPELDVDVQRRVATEAFDLEQAERPAQAQHRAHPAR